MKNLYLTLAIGALAWALAACSSPSPTATAIPSGPEFNSFPGASEFVVGENRFPFVLASLEGQLLEGAQVDVTFSFLAGEELSARVTLPAHYREARTDVAHVHTGGEVHPHQEVRGLYVVDDATFDTAGFWLASFSVASPGGGSPGVGELAFAVKEQLRLPDVGSPVPRTENLTLRDVVTIEEIDTLEPPDDMHDLTVAQALDLSKPFVVTWSTPLFCVTRVCGPVLEEVVALEDRYRDRVNFIHIEPWDLNEARGEGRLVPVPELLEWNLETEPWVFVVGADGLVSARFEGLVTTEELDKALQEALGSS